MATQDTASPQSVGSSTAEYDPKDRSEKEGEV